MKFALSTNWCNRRLESGEAIVDAAQELGFEALELGFHTTLEQAAGFKRRLGEMPVGSIHAFCPVPISAPQGYPELYQLASFDADQRAIAKVHVVKNLRFAAEMGADTVVLHCGRVSFSGFFRPNDSGRLRERLRQCEGKVEHPDYQKLLKLATRRREENGRRLLEAFKADLAAVLAEAEKLQVTLALENLPYYEGFPNEAEMKALLAEFRSSPLWAWFDTGHNRVRRLHGWAPSAPPAADELGDFAGMHINDVMDFNDDHLPPGEGKVDFAALKPLAEKVRHVVFEPNSAVRSEALRAGRERLAALWEKE